MNSNQMKYSVITCAIMAAAVCSGSVNATQVNTTVTLSMTVAASICSVAVQNANITLPPTNPTITTLAYMNANNLTTASAAGSSMYTSSSLNQTTTVTCTVPGTAITSLTVQPNIGTTIGSYGATALQTLVDTAASPLFAAKTGSGGTSWLWGAELYSINGVVTPNSFADSSWAIKSFPTSFATNTKSPSTATFIWRPTVNAGDSTQLGNPTGGKFSGSYIVVVNY